MTSVEFEIKSHNDTTQIVRTGTVLDNSNADSFSSLLMDLYSGGTKHVIIDMATLEFLSSAGVGAIVGTVELFREKDGDIVLTNVSDKISAILDVLSLSSYLTVCLSTEEATTRCGG
jgi:anti-sigma B factor antagonist